ncbi:hypothetical protein V6Z12_A09G212900 [Gossypium hirsutum]
MEDQKKKQLQLMKLIYGHILVFISIIIIVIQLLMIFSRICRDSPTSGSHFLIVLQHQIRKQLFRHRQGFHLIMFQLFNSES